MEDLERDGYVLSADPKRVDFSRVHRWLSEESYWAAGRPYDLVARSIEGSVPYSVFTSTTEPTSSNGTPKSTAGANNALIPSSPHPTPSGRAPSNLVSSSPTPTGLTSSGATRTTFASANPVFSDQPFARPAEQVAFARAVTDGATFAWICDVFVDANHRGHGLGKWMVDTILADLSERGIQRFLLATRDAHDVYRRSGFTELVGANRYMEIDHRPTRNAILNLP